ncbi:Uncharacterised protein [Escherichia coli]|nr:Uncharacterised protein [Escherichia coli]
MLEGFKKGWFGDAGNGSIHINRDMDMSCRSYDSLH